MSAVMIMAIFWNPTNLQTCCATSGSPHCSSAVRVLAASWGSWISSSMAKNSNPSTSLNVSSGSSPWGGKAFSLRTLVNTRRARSTFSFARSSCASSSAAFTRSERSSKLSTHSLRSHSKPASTRPSNSPPFKSGCALPPTTLTKFAFPPSPSRPSAAATVSAERAPWRSCLLASTSIGFPATCLESAASRNTEPACSNPLAVGARAFFGPPAASTTSTSTSDSSGADASITYTTACASARYSSHFLVHCPGKSYQCTGTSPPPWGKAKPIFFWVNPVVGLGLGSGSPPMALSSTDFPALLTPTMATVGFTPVVLSGTGAAAGDPDVAVAVAVAARSCAEPMQETTSPVFESRSFTCCNCTPASLSPSSNSTLKELELALSLSPITLPLYQLPAPPLYLTSTRDPTTTLGAEERGGTLWLEASDATAFALTTTGNGSPFASSAVIIAGLTLPSLSPSSYVTS
mmetsp:Transcript_5300/g.11152  ORF Transcript_5300/g.11152 Transcript_5300/m.11152 type:complete len:462 (+) Transcript_5300:251-1636(+)